ncbi:hypothetical protein J3R82DRAFT_9153 [Butyriboletus roseoflavus]|nr:hypothetical protein J3R82DRAFT_9153 [Butyriboletus roseoflavus]
MADLYPSGRHNSDRRSMSSSNENIPSTMGWEPDPSNESEHLDMLSPVKIMLTMDLSQRFSTARLRIIPQLGASVPFAICAMVSMLFLVAIHVVLVGMLFTHPEHSFSVSINNTGATIALRIFLHAFYLIYTAVLVLLTQQHTLSALMAQRQKLTAVHDISGAWNGIGAAISALWQQTKVTSSPPALVLIFIYLSCISGLHIISSSVIHFEAFNNTVTSVVPSSLTWPSSSVNLSTLDGNIIDPLMGMWPLLPTAKGLSGSTLFDVPLTDDAYTGAAVDATTISAECGLLSNLSVGTWNSTEGIFYVDVNGLGEVGLPVEGIDLSINYILSLKTYKNRAGEHGIIHRLFDLILRLLPVQCVTTAIELGNLTGEVLQVDLEGPAGVTSHGEPAPFNISTTSYFVACTLNATTTPLYLSMQGGKITNTESLPNNSKEVEPWTIWSPGNTTEFTKELVQMFDNIQIAGRLSCQGLQFPAGSEECIYILQSDMYTNSLLDIPWMPSWNSTIETPALPIVLEKTNMENAIAQTAAAYIRLAGAVGVDDGGFQQDQGESLISYNILEFRLNVTTTPVVIGLFASCMLLATMVWMFHHLQPTHSKGTITSPNILGLIWISAHSISLQAFMKSGNSLLDQLRLKGMKADACLADMKSEPIRVLGSIDHNLQMDVFSGHIIEGQLFMHWLCYGLHAILFAFHMILALLLIKHPEHNVTMASDNPWVTTALTVSLQAFYILYTAGLVFITQQLALSAIIAQRDYLTAVHDIAEAWNGIGTALYTLWQQTKVASSTWTMLGVVSYLACVSTLQIASTTIMQFTAFNSSSIITMQSTMAFPNATILVNGTWWGAFDSIPSSSLLSNIQTTGLLNNTLYDTLNTTDSSFTNAIVNATSLQASCGLLSNLTFDNSGLTPTLNFSVNNFGSGSFGLYMDASVSLGGIKKNQIDFMSINSNFNFHPACSSCELSFLFLITTGIELDEPISNTAINLSVNIAQDNTYPITAYLAACTLSSQTTNSILNLQAGTLTPSPAWAGFQPWQLWTPGIEGSLDLFPLVDTIFYNTGFGVCPQNGFVGCQMNANASFSETSSSLYTLTPNQLQQAIEDSVAAIIWTAGQLGSNQGGFDRMTGESQVTQVITEWRLNINTVPVAFASTASLILFILVLCLIRIPSRLPQNGRSITGLSVLETLWVAAHSQTICENMVDLNDPSLDDLRRAGMFKVCLSNVRGSQFNEAESVTFLE